jgi:hypothetical protein
MADYLPQKDAELAVWSTNFTGKVVENAPLWSIPENKTSDLQTATDKFVDLHEKVDSPEKTTVLVAEKNLAREDLVTKIRGMVGYWLKNPIITDADRIALGLHVRDSSHTSIPVPKTRPEIDIDVLDFRRLKIVFHDMGSNKKAKPYGVNGAVIAYAILDTPPNDIAILTRSVLATRTPHTLEFTESERGKTVYVAICWQNEKGEKGPWSEIEKAIVP